MPRNPSREFCDGMAVLRACGHVSRQVYLELMAHMEDKWPDRGWIVQYQALKDFYAAQDKQLMERGEGMRFEDVAGRDGFVTTKRPTRLAGVK